MAKKKVVKQPKDLTEFRLDMERIGELERQIEGAQLNAEDQMAAIRASLQHRLDPRVKELSDLLGGLVAFAEANKVALTDAGKLRTIQLGDDNWFGWRLSPPGVEIRGEKAVIKRLQEAGLDRFIRQTPKIDREAMLKDRAAATAVVGVKIVQRDDLVIHPANLNADVIPGRGSSYRVEGRKKPAS
ncbi:MAG: host-nuclease inhibitor Gam family protein [Candidatus Komeilibacteria bacterium]